MNFDHFGRELSDYQSEFSGHWLPVLSAELTDKIERAARRTDGTTETVMAALAAGKQIGGLRRTPNHCPIPAPRGGDISQQQTATGYGDLD